MNNCQQYKNGAYLAKYTATFAYGCAVSHIFFFIAGLVGNLLLCFTIVKNYKRAEIHEILLLNLAISDLLYAIVSFTVYVPIMLRKYQGKCPLIKSNNLVCRVSGGLPLYFGFANVYSLTLLAYVRYSIIVKRQPSRNFRNKIAYISVVWLIPAVLVIPHVMDIWGDFFFIADLGMCAFIDNYLFGSSSISHFIVIALCGIAIPSNISFWCHMKIYLYVRQNQKRINVATVRKAAGNSSNNQSQPTEQSLNSTGISSARNKDIAVAITLTLMTLVYTISCLPYLAFIIIAFFDKPFSASTFQALSIGVHISYIGTVANPIIILLRGKELNNYIKNCHMELIGSCNICSHHEL
ncbi:putative G-protein coupled receptor 45 [Trichoplax sp. H2]|nr:putative G-protein coupled receptor 45 [Trichoplax sp. H2]|eukprot:RDD46699.1 putative G-protein coupled receptor 45 [Trichoplax sp. H2]